MTQNSAPSQDLKCTVCTHPWPRLRARCALGRPCRGAPGAVSQASPSRIVAFLSAVSQLAPVVSQAVSRVVSRAVWPLARSRCCTSCRRPPRPCRAHGRSYLGRARPCRAPLLGLPGLRACSACCVLAQLAVCLLSLLCACSACYVPQYS